MNKSILSKVLLGIVVLFMASCATTHEIMLADVITFADDANTSYSYRKGPAKNLFKQSHPYEVYKNGKYNRKEAAAVKGKLDAIATTSGFNTAGYYALDLGLDRVKYVRKKVLKGDKQTRYYIIYLTDGLDNTSVQVAKNNRQGNYKNDEEYINKLNKKKAKLMGCGKNQQCFQIYPMLYIGADLDTIQKQNEMNDTLFLNWAAEQMKPFEGASKGWEKQEAMLDTVWKDLAKKLEEKFTSASYEFYVPKGYINKRIRMTLYDERGVKTSIEGLYTKKGGKYILKDVELKGGLSSKTGRTDDGRKFPVVVSFNNNDKKSDKSWFKVENLNCNGLNYKVYTGSNSELAPKQDYFNKNYWLFNSEYDKSARASVNTYILFVADVSASLGKEGPIEESELLKAFYEMVTASIRK